MANRRLFLFVPNLRVPIFLLALSFLAYGVLLPKMGFYWDDWPWIWLQHVDGKAGMLAIDRAFRPLSGVMLWLFSLFAGQKPLLWQGINFLLRWLSGLTCYLALSEVFSHQKNKVVWVAVLFLLYPGYTHQFVAVNSSRHLLAYSWFFLSVWVMIQNARAAQFSWLRAMGALGLQSLGMLTTEYFYGLELLRPLLLWLALEHQAERKQRIQSAAIQSLPYTVVLIAVVGWRFAITRLPAYNNYSILLFDERSAAVSTNFVFLLQEWLRQIYVSLILGWAKGFEFPQPATFGTLKTGAYGLLVLSTALFVGFFLGKLRPLNESSKSKELILLGMITLAVGGLPFLAAGLPMGVNFPPSRLTLPMSFGAGLLLVGGVERIPSSQWIKISLIALLSGLAVGAHFQNAVAFQRDWSYQRAFFEQLRWRVPQIKPGTLLLSNIISETHSSDNSLTAALNWLYFDTVQGEDLPLLFFYVETRQASYFPNPVSGVEVERQYGRFRFRGHTDRTLVLFFEPPACLRLLDPNLDRFNPTLSEEIRQVAHLSNWEQVEEMPHRAIGDFPLALNDAAESWCYFYQKAEWARQKGKWEEVVAWGEKGRASGDSPNRADERIPLIQGYAMLGNWSRAIELTHETLRINPRLNRILCQLWREIEQNTAPSESQQSALRTVYQTLKCENN